MRLTITCDGSPISVLLDSISVTKELSGRTSSASFRIPISGTAGLYDTALYDVSTYADESSTVIPNQQSVVEISNADTDELIFAGFVVRVSRDQANRALQFWSVTVAGWEALLETAVYSGTFTGQSDRDIIQTIFEDVLPEITTDSSTVEELAVALDQTFKDATLREVLERLSSISGAEYFITPAKELIWRSEGSVTAPITISDEPNNTTSFAWRQFKPDRSSVGFANSIEVLGAFTGVGGTELRATAENLTSIADIGLRARRLVARDVTSQSGLDLLAGIELDRRAVQESISFQTDAPGLEVGQLLTISSFPAAVNGDFVIQTVKLRQRSPSDTVYEVSVGDYRGSIAERLRQLDRIKTGPKLVVVPPAIVLPDSITSLELADGAVTTLKIAAAAVEESRIAVGAVTESILAAAAVSETKIASNAISTPKIQTGAVVAGKIAAGAVTAGTIAAGAVTAGTIAAGSITSAQAVFATAAIQSADINTLSASKLTAGTIDASVITVTNLSASNINTGTLNASVVTVSNLSASNITTGTLSVSRIAAGTITGTLLANGTVADVNIASGLSASKVTTGTLNASVVTVSNLSASSINTGTLNCSLITVSNLSASSITTGTMSASRLSSGTTTVGSGGLTISGTGGLTVVGSGNIQASPGYVEGTSLRAIVAAGGWVISGSNSAATISFTGTAGATINATGYNISGSNVINSSGSYVGTGVNTPNYGHAAAGFNAFVSGVQYFGGTQTVVAAGLTWTFKGGSFVSAV